MILVWLRAAGRRSMPVLKTSAFATFMVAALATAQAGPARAGGVDVCSLIGQAQIEAALGGPAVRAPGGTVGGCAWRSSSVAGDGVTIQVDDGGQEKFTFDRGRLTTVALRGVGDDAFAFNSLAGFVQLGLLKNGSYVTIVLQRQDDPGRLDKAKGLAAFIAGRM
jgi:hypothetical protein